MVIHFCAYMFLFLHYVVMQLHVELVGLWIFFIDEVFCFLKINGSGMENEERSLEMSLQGEDESRTSAPPQEAMDKSLKVGEDEWMERETEEQNFEREKRDNEV